MGSKVCIIAALGNPGREYERTRHNMGFMLADHLVRNIHDARWRAWQTSGVYCEAELSGKKVFILKPQTYMNNSGLAVRGLADFYKVPPSGVLVVYDDMSIPFGKMKLRRDGSAGGHNGMSSIIGNMGTQEIPRLKMGIGPRPARIDAKDFVLGKLSAQEEAGLGDVLERGCKAVCTVLESGLEEAMNIFNYDSDQSVS